MRIVKLMSQNPSSETKQDNNCLNYPRVVRYLEKVEISA